MSTCKATREEEALPAADGGYGWIVLLTTFLIRIILYGITMTPGVMFVVFLEEFQQGQGHTAWVGSTITAVSYLACPVSGILTDKFGARIVVIAGGVLASLGLCLSMLASNVEYLIVSYGCVTGFGFGILYIPLSIIVAEYFHHKRNIAMGIASAGGGCGNLVFPPIIRFLIECYGWRGTFMIFGALSLNVCVGGLLLRPLRISPKLNSDHKSLVNSEKSVKRCCDWSMFQSPGYMVMHLNNFLFTFGVSIVYVHLAAFAAVNANLDDDMSATLFSILGASVIVAKIVLGLLALKIDAYLLYIVCFCVAGVSSFFAPFAFNFITLSVYTLVFGLSSSGFGGALIPAILVDMISLDKLSLSYGYLYISAGIGQLLGAPCAGWLFDYYKSYNVPFYLAGACMTASGLIVIMPWKFMSREKKIDADQNVLYVKEVESYQEKTSIEICECVITTV